jgi:hypothetical protein
MPARATPEPQTIRDAKPERLSGFLWHAARRIINEVRHQPGGLRHHLEAGWHD